MAKSILARPSAESLPNQWRGTCRSRATSFGSTSILTGHEQAGRCPALVPSATEYNRKVGLMICCPLTNQVKGYPFEVPVEGTAEVSGVALADQVKSLDWRARNAKKKARAPKRVSRSNRQDECAAAVRALAGMRGMSERWGG